MRHFNITIHLTTGEGGGHHTPTTHDITKQFAGHSTHIHRVGAAGGSKEAMRESRLLQQCIMRSACKAS